MFNIYRYRETKTNLLFKEWSKIIPFHRSRIWCIYSRYFYTPVSSVYNFVAPRRAFGNRWNTKMTETLMHFKLTVVLMMWHGNRSGYGLPPPRVHISHYCDNTIRVRTTLGNRSANKLEPVHMYGIYSVKNIMHWLFFNALSSARVFRVPGDIRSVSRVRFPRIELASESRPRGRERWKSSVNRYRMRKETMRMESYIISTTIDDTVRRTSVSKKKNKTHLLHRLPRPIGVYQVHKIMGVVRTDAASNANTTYIIIFLAMHAVYGRRG